LATPNRTYRQSWLRTVEGDLHNQNIGLSLAWHIALDVPAGIVFRKQLYSGKSEPLDADDEEEDVNGVKSWLSVISQPVLRTYCTET